VSLKDGLRGNRVYVIIAIFIIIVIILTFLFSNSHLNPAYVPYDVLDRWYEDITERSSGSQVFGLESWSSFTYRNDNNNYPSYVTVTTIKKIFMMNENELEDKTRDTILEKASEQNISIDKNTEIFGQRALKKGHKTMYVVYDGVRTLSDDTSEQVKFIGETWNCDRSCTSIICIGYSQVTNNSYNNSELNLKYWAEIIADNEGTFMEEYVSSDYYNKLLNSTGLIYNVKCH
jgi:hypothetical protein